MALKDIYSFARMGKIEAIREAVNSGVDINGKDEFGMSALQCAIAYNQIEMAHLLLSMGADVTIQDSDGSTAVHYAVEYELPDVVIALLEKYPQAVNISNKYGNQPLWTAIFNAKKDFRIISILLDYGADIDHLNYVSRSPLDILKRKKNSPLLGYFRQRMPDRFS
jgi:uncharacterized protein